MEHSHHFLRRIGAGAALLALLAWPSAAVAAVRVVIVVGLAADEDQAGRLKKSAEAARAAFVARGIGAEAIRVVAPAEGAPVKRDAVLAALRWPGVAADDETWILLLGNAAAGRDGRPVFQVSGPRVTADDFAAAVGVLPGKKFVVVATARSGGFLRPLVPLVDVEGVAATAEEGEINEPRFAAEWVSALKEQPYADFLSLVTAATTRVAASYQRESLAPGEHAQLIEHTAGEIVAVVPKKPAAAP